MRQGQPWFERFNRIGEIEGPMLNRVHLSLNEHTVHRAIFVPPTAFDLFRRYRRVYSNQRWALEAPFEEGFVHVQEEHSHGAGSPTVKQQIYRMPPAWIRPQEDSHQHPPGGEKPGEGSSRPESVDSVKGPKDPKGVGKRPVGSLKKSSTKSGTASKRKRPARSLKEPLTEPGKALKVKRPGGA